MKYSPLYTAIYTSLLLTVSPLSIADDIEHIEVIGEALPNSIISASTEPSNPENIASALLSLPGANINSNGKVTSIVQYRGLYGDRVSAKLGGQTFIGSGPNAMDTPLSYSPGIITESISIYRGIAPVSAGIETLGGAVDVQLTKAEFSNSRVYDIQGALSTSFNSNNEAFSAGGKVNIASENIASLAYIETHDADDLETAQGPTLKPSGYTKTQAGIETRFQYANSEIGASYHYTDTHDAGTPALPMDITYIYGNKFSLDGAHELSIASTKGTLTWQLGYFDSSHEMDNFSQRTQNNAAMYRVNNADAKSYDANVLWLSDDIQFGIEGVRSSHDSIITNPNNMMFNVVNFNDVVNTKVSAFGQWQKDFDDISVQIGSRIKHIKADADDVNHHMAMGNATIANLVNGFNQADRSQSDTNVDLVIRTDYQLDKNTSVNVSLASKQRAPSYQERYLWLPMEATAGLADGNTYLGNIDLESETATQLNLGYSYTGDKLIVLFDGFYQRIDDYIQGLLSTDMATNMLAAMMMNSDRVLQFSNVDASLQGFDGQIKYQLNESWQIDAVASYVRGKRKDIDDNLYRIAPPNITTSIHYNQDNWQLTLAGKVYAKQDKVSALNREQASAGYAVFDLNGQYNISNQLTVNAGIKNLLDKNYRNHLGGYNRVMENGFTHMDRLPSEGRSVWANVSYQF